MLEIVFFYVLCFTRPRYQVSVYRTIGPLVSYYRPLQIWTLKICNHDISRKLYELGASNLVS